VWLPAHPLRRRMALAMPASLQHAGNKRISTTRNEQFVVENHPQKSPLKVLVEAFLLAFCPTCRRADIFHNERILSRSNTNSAENSVPKPALSKFSVVCPSERLLVDLTKEARRAPFRASEDHGPVLRSSDSTTEPSISVGGRPQKAVPTFGKFRPPSGNAVLSTGGFCRDRLLRRSAMHWTSSIHTSFVNFFSRSEGCLPSRQDSSPISTQSKSKRGIS
jgi:hypothetical protein